MWKKTTKNFKIETNDFIIRCNSAFFSKINIIDLNTRDRGKYEAFRKRVNTFFQVFNQS